MQEIEAKILEINVEEVEARLKDLGAILEFESEFHAIYFDPGESGGKTLRLRREGDECRLVWKEAGQQYGGVLERQELETSVGNLEAARSILLALGFPQTKEMLKIRRQFILEDVHVVIDRYLEEYAHIPTYLEIEGPNSERVEAVAEMLGFGADELEAVTIGELIPRYAHLQ